MSSLLLSEDFQITEYEYNTILNSVNLYRNDNNYQFVHPSVLIPALNSTSLNIGYERILNDGDMFVRQISQTSGFRFSYSR